MIIRALAYTCADHWQLQFNIIQEDEATGRRETTATVTAAVPIAGVSLQPSAGAEELGRLLQEWAWGESGR